MWYNYKTHDEGSISNSVKMETFYWGMATIFYPLKRKISMSMRKVFESWHFSFSIIIATSHLSLIYFHHHNCLDFSLSFTAKIFLFYLIFYAALAAFFEICWLLFATTLIEGRPKWELEQSIIGTNPGLGFRPMPPESNVESTLIWYEKNNPKNSEYWVNELEHFLKGKAPLNLKNLN